MPRNPLSAVRYALLISTCLLSACEGTGSSPWGGRGSTNPWAVPQPPADNASTAPVAAAPETSPLPPSLIQPTPAAAKVALLLPLTGRGADTGQAMLNAAQLAMFDLNATSLFELLPQDTGEGADQAAIKALQANSNLIIGPLFSDSTKIVAPIALQKGINVVSFSTDVSAAMGSTFLMGFVPQTQVEQILDYAASSGLRNIAVIAPRDTYGDSVTSTFYGHVQRRGLTNAGILRYDAKSGLTPDQIKTISASTQAVLIAASGPEAAKISAQLTAQGLPPSTVKRLGTGLWDQPAVAKIPELQGAWYAASSPRLRVKFEQRYFETYGQQPPRLASLAYDATALAVVLAKSGRGYGRDTLTNPSGFAGIDGIFRFRQDGLAERGLAILEINNGNARVIREAPNNFSGQ